MNDPRVDQIPKAPAGGSVGKSDSCESLEVTGGCVTAPGQRQGDSGQRREKSEQAKKECNVPRKKNGLRLCLQFGSPRWCVCL